MNKVGTVAGGQFGRAGGDGGHGGSADAAADWAMSSVSAVFSSSNVPPNVKVLLPSGSRRDSNGTHTRTVIIKYIHFPLSLGPLQERTNVTGACPGEGDGDGDGDGGGGEVRPHSTRRKQHQKQQHPARTRKRRPLPTYSTASTTS